MELPWLTCLCSITQRCWVVVPSFKRRDQRIYSSYRHTTILSLPEKFSSRVLERRTGNKDYRTLDSVTAVKQLTSRPALCHACLDGQDLDVYCPNPGSSSILESCSATERWSWRWRFRTLSVEKLYWTVVVRLDCITGLSFF